MTALEIEVKPPRAGEKLQLLDGRIVNIAAVHYRTRRDAWRVTYHDEELGRLRGVQATRDGVRLVQWERDFIPNRHSSR